MHAAESRGEVAKGTSHRWEHETPNKKKLPRHVRNRKSRRTRRR